MLKLQQRDIVWPGSLTTQRTARHGSPVHLKHDQQSVYVLQCTVHTSRTTHYGQRKQHLHHTQGSYFFWYIYIYIHKRDLSRFMKGSVTTNPAVQRLTQSDSCCVVGARYRTLLCWRKTRGSTIRMESVIYTHLNNQNNLVMKKKEDFCSLKSL